MFIYHKNNVITGSLDAYCLVCETYFKSKDDVDDHIQDDTHKNNLDSTQYHEMYGNDKIKKVKNGYYCEFCNILFPSLIKVILHINDTQHCSNKLLQSCKRINNDILIFDSIYVSEDAWNGILDGYCFICNMKIEDGNLHKSEEDHIVNLINCNIEFLKNSVYRENLSGFQCLSCNMKIPLGDSTINKHFDSTHHQTVCAKSLELKKPIANSSSIIFCNDRTDSHKSTVVNKSPDISKSTAGVNQSIDKTNDSNNLNNVNKPTAVNKSTDVNKSIDATNFNDANKSTGVNKSPDATKLRDIKTSCNVNKPNDATMSTDVNKSTSVTDDVIKSNNMICDETVKPQTRDVKEFKNTFMKDFIDKYDPLDAVNYIQERENPSEALCLLCDWVIDDDGRELHINSEHHQTLRKLHKARLEKMIEISKGSPRKEIISSTVKSEPSTSQSNAEVDENTKTHKMLQSVEKFKMNDFKIDLETSTAICKKCSKCLTLKYNDMKIHIEEHKKITEKKMDLQQEINGNDAPPKTQSILNFDSLVTKQHEQCDCYELIANDKKFNFSFNKPTSFKISSQVALDFREYKKTTAISTEEFNEPPKKATPLTDIATKDLESFKVCMDTLCKFYTVLENSGMALNIIAFEDKLAISEDSYSLVKFKDDVLYECLYCEFLFSKDEKASHVLNDKHQKAMETVMIISSLDTEFVREIRPSVFHCGFCNTVETDWDRLKKHLNSTPHKETRQHYEWYMRTMRPVIKEEIRKKRVVKKYRRNEGVF